MNSNEYSRCNDIYLIECPFFILNIFFWEDTVVIDYIANYGGDSQPTTYLASTRM